MHTASAFCTALFEQQESFLVPTAICTVSYHLAWQCCWSGSALVGPSYVSCIAQ